MSLPCPETACLKPRLRCRCSCKIYRAALVIVRALTIRQPYASLIFLASRDVENRSWPTKYRGDLVICASLKVDPRACKKFGLDPAELPRGMALGRVTISDCVRNHRSKWAERGHWHWVLENPRGFAEPIPVRGRLGIYRIDLPISR